MAETTQAPEAQAEESKAQGTSTPPQEPVAEQKAPKTATPPPVVEVPTLQSVSLDKPVLTAKDLGVSTEGSGMLAPVIKRAYSEQDSPKGETSDTQGTEGGEAPTIISNQEASKQSATFFGLNLNKGFNFDKPVEEKIPESVATMRFQDPSSQSQSQEVPKGKSTTSQFVCDQLENYYPELLDIMSKMDEKEVEALKLTPDLKNQLTVYIKTTNERNRKKLDIPQKIMKPLREGTADLFTNLGVETNLPSWLPLLVGVIALVWWSITTTKEIKEDNEFYYKQYLRDLGVIQNKNQLQIEELQAQLTELKNQAQA